MRGVLAALGIVRQPTPTERAVAFLVQWAILAVAVWVAANLVDGIHLVGWESTVVVALIVGLLNAILKPLLAALALPLTVLTLGLFHFVFLFAVNAVALWLTDIAADRFRQIDFSIDFFFWDAVAGAIIISVVSSVLGWFIKPGRIARDVGSR